MIIQTIPMLPSTDLKRTAAFYQRLGFEVKGDTKDYLIVARDGQELHFFLHKGGKHADHSDFACYIRVEGLIDLYDDYHAIGLAAVPPIEQPWGMKELYLVDPDGSLLRFGEVISA